MRLHGAAVICVVVFGCWLRVNSVEWAILTLCVGAVISLECINTSIECLADHVCPTQDPLIKQVKDVAAAGVLAMSIAAAIVGGVVFLPKILMLFAIGN